MKMKTMLLKDEKACVEFQSSYFAFRQWFRRASDGDAEVGAEILKALAVDNLAGNIVWLVLECTGEKYYSAAVFRQAAEFVLEIEAKERAAV